MSINLDREISQINQLISESINEKKVIERKHKVKWYQFFK